MKRRDLFSILMTGLVAVMIGITGCDGGDDDDSSATGDSGVVGTWTLNTATITAPLVGDNAGIIELVGADVDGNTMTADSNFLSLFGVAVTLIVDNDGTWAVSVTVPAVPGYVGAGTYSAEGTYVLNGNRTTVTVTSVPAEAAGLLAEGDTYTISYNQSGDAMNLSASSADLGMADVSASLDFTRQ